MTKTMLTARLVGQLKPGEKRREIADTLLPGLYLIIQPSGERSWALRYRHSGRPAKFTLGPAIAERSASAAVKQELMRGMALTLGEARELGRKALSELAEGRAPHLEQREQGRKPAAEIVTAKDELATVVELFLDRHVRRRLRPSTIKDMEWTFRTQVVPYWGRRRLAEISRSDVIDLLDDLVDAGKGATANRVLRQLGTFFGWCIDRGLLSVTPTARVRKPHEDRPRERWLDDFEIAWFWTGAKKLGYPFGPMLQLLVLSGVRREELRAATWREFDLEAGTWTIGPTRTKNGRPHLVLLSDPARAILADLPRIAGVGYLFTTSGDKPATGFSNAKLRIDKAMVAEATAPESGGVAPTIPAWTFHDLRRTMASGMARLGIALPVIEKCLNHVSGSFGGVAGIYQHHDFREEKAAAWSAWARHVEAIAAPRAGIGVIPFRRAV